MNAPNFTDAVARLRARFVARPFNSVSPQECADVACVIAEAEKARAALGLPPGGSPSLTEQLAALVAAPALDRAHDALVEALEGFLFELSGEQFDGDGELDRLRKVDEAFRAARRKARAALALAKGGKQ